MGRTCVASDDVGRLLQAAGNEDIDAFAALYDRTASVIFRCLSHVLTEPAAAERAMVRVYGRVWRTASSFDPAQMSGGAFLVQAMSREFDRRQRS